MQNALTCSAEVIVVERDKVDLLLIFVAHLLSSRHTFER